MSGFPSRTRGDDFDDRTIPRRHPNAPPPGAPAQRLDQGHTSRGKCHGRRRASTGRLSPKKGVGHGRITDGIEAIGGLNPVTRIGWVDGQMGPRAKHFTQFYPRARAGIMGLGKMKAKSKKNQTVTHKSERPRCGAKTRAGARYAARRHHGSKQAAPCSGHQPASSHRTWGVRIWL